MTLMETSRRFNYITGQEPLDRRSGVRSTDKSSAGGAGCDPLHNSSFDPVCIGSHHPVSCVGLVSRIISVPLCFQCTNILLMSSYQGSQLALQLAKSRTLNVHIEGLASTCLQLQRFALYSAVLKVLR